MKLSDAAKASNEGRAGPIWAALIDGELERARARVQSVQQRGLTVITSSGTLLTLLVGVAAFARGDVIKTEGLKPLTTLAVLATLICFALAALGGLWANMDRGFVSAADPDTLERLLNPTFWDGGASIAERRLAELHVDQLKDTTYLYWKIAFVLRWAILFQAAGVLALTAAAMGAIISV
jgi:hypothetical protein